MCRPCKKINEYISPDIYTFDGEAVQTTINQSLKSTKQESEIGLEENKKKSIENE